jgi:uncharacterized protein DUF1569
MKTLANGKDRQEILDRLARVRPDSTRKWGKMSAHQMVCHLNDSFHCATGDKYVSPHSNFLLRTLVKWFALHVPIHWPPGYPTRPEMDQLIGGTRPMEFAADVEKLRKTIERFTNSQKDFTWHPHPGFGQMTEEEWMRWGYLHTDHHFRQFGA